MKRICGTKRSPRQREEQGEQLNGIPSIVCLDRITGNGAVSREMEGDSCLLKLKR